MCLLSHCCYRKIYFVFVVFCFCIQSNYEIFKTKVKARFSVEMVVSIAWLKIFKAYCMALNTCLDGQQVESAVMGRKRKPDKLFADFSSLVN